MFDRVLCTDGLRWHTVPLRAALGAVCASQAFSTGGAQGALMAVLGFLALSGLLTRLASALILAAAAAGLPQAATAAGCAAALLMSGGGRWSLDAMIQERLISCHFSIGPAADDDA